VSYRVLITGSRTWEDREAIGFELADVAILYPEAVVVHGACPRGADAMADVAARTLGLAVEPHAARKSGIPVRWFRA
jgi:YspA, cpYpsA-related SLOG family